MKESRYNHTWNIENKNNKLVFNAMTGALAEFDLKTLDILDNISHINMDELDVSEQETINLLETNGFVIADCVDEYKILKFRYNNAKYDRTKLNLTIAPTLDCNFKCFYCYQEKTAGSISDNIVTAITDFVKNSSCHIDKLNVSWYGGEPLLEVERIIKMSQQFIKMSNETNFKYEASMITNGFLFDQQNIIKLRETNLTDVQITIDGPPEVHNKRRPLINNHIETFEQIIENIKLLRKADVNVTIRINIDKSNFQYIEALLDVLIAQNLLDVNIYLGQVKPYSPICQNLHNLFLGSSEMSELDFDLQRLLIKKGFKSKSSLAYPEVKGSYCFCDHNNSYVINYNGDMYKCWGEIGNTSRRLGNILSFQEDTDKTMLMNYINWMFWDPFENASCRDCKFLPVCMGGCPYAGYVINQGTPECIKWKFNLEKIIKLQYIMTTNGQ